MRCLTLDSVSQLGGEGGGDNFKEIHDLVYLIMNNFVTFQN
jgi:hypothetical protein